MPPLPRLGSGSRRTASRCTRRKTRIANCRKKGNGFEFLGYRFERGRRHVRKKSLTKLKETIRDKTRRTCGLSLARISHNIVQFEVTPFEIRS